MFKKIISFISAICVIFALTGCSTNTENIVPEPTATPIAISPANRAATLNSSIAQPTNRTATTIIAVIVTVGNSVRNILPIPSAE